MFVKMRRSVVIFLVINTIVITLLVRSVFTLLTLLTETGDADAITRGEIPAPNSTLIETLPRLIPKIIHQTYINETIPERWREPRQQCIDMHEDYEHMLWTDESAREFIAKEYPWFIETFDNYPFAIQRADTIRYFVLAHFGGTYIDLDDGCNRRLDPLLAYPAWLHRTDPTGISNDAMGSVPKHPFFLSVIHSLIDYNKDWVFPYITVMYTTGPLFLSVLWKKYMNSGKNVGDGLTGGRVRILMNDDYHKKPWSFFNQFVGSSWHGEDARFIFWMGDHWFMLTVAGFAAAGVVGLFAWWVWGMVVAIGSRNGLLGKRKGWRGGSPWRLGWMVRRKEGYELVDRHEV